VQGESGDEMPTIKVDEYDCIGILSIPVLKLELPVLADWSYKNPKKAPCHYYGMYYGKDFVIAAHNITHTLAGWGNCRQGILLYLPMSAAKLITMWWYFRKPCPKMPLKK